MDFFKCFIKTYWTYIVILFLTLLLIGTTSYIFAGNNDAGEGNKTTIAIEDTSLQEQPDTFYVDIKGAVKKPDVYKVDCTKIINDVIKLAGGLTKNAYTKNVNLSKKVESEMVIYIYTKSEYKKLNTKKTEIKECVSKTYYIDSCTEKASSVITSSNEKSLNDSTTSESSKNDFSNESIKEEVIESNTTSNEFTNQETKLISINTASATELMTLNGIGESKANNIIKYREEHGQFKSIEEIKNVSGIGDAAFEKIKNNITV